MSFVNAPQVHSNWRHTICILDILARHDDMNHTKGIINTQDNNMDKHFIEGFLDVVYYCHIITSLLQYSHDCVMQHNSLLFTQHMV